LKDLAEGWQTNEWVNSANICFTYDANGNMLTELDESWKNDSIWVNDQRYTYTYDGNEKSCLFY